jgi:hypothetical protein
MQLNDHLSEQMISLRLEVFRQMMTPAQMISRRAFRAASRVHSANRMSYGKGKRLFTA